jgi:hypothetical protein
MDHSPALVSRRLAPDAWADRFRLACQTCAAHLAGPVVAWSALVEHLDADERRVVGESIVRASRGKLESSSDATVQRRELAVVRFVTDLFGLASAASERPDDVDQGRKGHDADLDQEHDPLSGIHRPDPTQ